MAVRPEGTPVWADAMFKDVEVAKLFYGDVLGWTFGESSTEYGNYTQAYRNGKAVAAVVPPMPGQDDGEAQSAWCLYFASPDAAATAEKIKAAGGTVLMEPMQVGDFGSMCLAQDPAGAVFGIWQAGRHEGFELEGESGSYVWAEVFTREPAKADPFYTAVFGYNSKKMQDEEMDYRVFDLGADPVLGRMVMTAEDFPPEIPSYIQVYFAVDNCDKAVEAAERLNGRKVFGPMDSPFGRFAAILDPQGAAFAVIDVRTTVGEMPEMV
ncbi:VOC family protein [Streptomyces sp. NPDC059556]|uniref:VOC family protein n=1 Tax=Streptomyces sp. NPDC059556 TaxID=3346863 RepID=UPI0036B7837C